VGIVQADKNSLNLTEDYKKYIVSTLLGEGYFQNSLNCRIPHSSLNISVIRNSKHLTFQKQIIESYIKTFKARKLIAKIR
jgi:hypothetical protein